ncbi:MAG: hypothetical protein ACRBF0_10620 [Calditrichia bacterium]
MNIVEYLIVGWDSAAELSTEVTKMISLGWQPFGVLSVQQLIVEPGYRGEGYNFYFNQVMVKYHTGSGEEQLGRLDPKRNIVE